MPFYHDITMTQEFKQIAAAAANSKDGPRQLCDCTKYSSLKKPPPAQPPQVMGTKIEPTAPNIPFIALLRGNAKRYMQDSSTGSDLASYLS